MGQKDIKDSKRKQGKIARDKKRDRDLDRDGEKSSRDRGKERKREQGREGKIRAAAGWRWRKKTGMVNRTERNMNMGRERDKGI